MKLLRMFDNHEMGIVSVLLAVCLLLSLVIGFDLSSRATFPDREYVIATDHSPPFQVINPDGTVTGAVAEALERAAVRRGIKLRWRTVTGGPDRHLGVDPQVDLWPFVMALPEREKRIHIAQTFVTADYLIATIRPPAEVSLAALAGKRVAFRDIPYFRKMFAQIYPQSIPVPIKEVDDVLLAACRGDVDAAVTEPNQLQDFLLRNRSGCAAATLQTAGIPEWRVNLSIGSTFESAPVADALRAELGVMARERAMDDLFIRFQPLGSLRGLDTFRETETERSSQVAIYSLVTLGFLSAILGLRVIRLRRRTARALLLADDRYRYLADMSHELRTPLNGILGMANLMKDADLDATHRDYLQVIEHSGHELLSIINNVLDLAKLDHHGATPEMETVCPRELADTLFRIFVPTLQARDIEEVLEVEPAVPDRLRIDAAKFRQIFVNLVGNAAKFTKTGFVHVRLSLVVFPSEDRHLRVEVIDSGPGISPAEQARLFRAFSQAGSSRDTSHKGTGLGLEISKRLAYYSGGRIGVDSVLGAGSSFWFEIPCEAAGLADPAVRSAPQMGMSLALLREKRVSIAGGHPRMRSSLASALAQIGGSARTFDTINDLCAEVSPLPDLILVDAGHLRDRERPGLEALDRLRAASAAAVAILCNGNSDMAYVRTLGKQWLRPLLKPVRLVDLIPTPPEAWEQGADLAKLANALALVTAEPGRQGPAPVATPRPHTETQDPGGSRLRILVGEDNPVNRMVIQAIIDRLGHDGHVVPDGQRLVAELERGECYDLILMDCNMPGMDGFQAARHIRDRLPHCENIPILAVTANTPSEVRERCLASGMNDVIAKPVTADLLRGVFARYARARFAG